jgi:peptide/nickel transport system permease protein
MKNEPRSEGYWRMVARRFSKSRVATTALVVIVIFFTVAALADLIANDKPLIMSYEGVIHFPALKEYAVWAGLSEWPPRFQNISFKEFAAAQFSEDDWAVFPPIPYSPSELNLRTPLRRPSAEHWFGTDDLGRDVASRTIHGARISLSVGFVAVSIYLLIGVALGSLAGYYGGFVDMMTTRVIEVMLTIPTLFLILTIVAFLPQSVFYIMLVIGLTNWPGIARLTRGEFLKAKSMDYVVAARALGATDLRTIVRHILPNTLAPVFVAATFGVASAILIESTLSFLGFGASPSAPSWGSMLFNARQLLPSAWWLSAFPGIAVFLAVISYNLLGEGLRDASDPRLRG